MSARYLAAALLFFGAVALGAAPYLGSPWPGVALSAISASVYAWGERNEGKARGVIDALSRMTTLEDKLNEVRRMALDAQTRIDEQGQQINSLRNAASLRGTLGG